MPALRHGYTRALFRRSRNSRAVSPRRSTYRMNRRISEPQHCPAEGMIGTEEVDVFG